MNELEFNINHMIYNDTNVILDLNHLMSFPRTFILFITPLNINDNYFNFFINHLKNIIIDDWL